MKVHEGEVFVGRAGRATEVIGSLEAGDKPGIAGTVAAWFLQCPGQSVAWQHYFLCMVHLRPIEGVKPAHISREGATHEVMLVALNPKMNPVPGDPYSWRWLSLSPFNFVGQLILPSDDYAKGICRLLARAVTDGVLWTEPPLAGQSEPWASQLRHIEDHAAGKHGTDNGPLLPLPSRKNS